MQIDHNLVRKCQTRCGRLAHAANNLMQTYTNWVWLYNKYGGEEYKVKAEEAERELRKFVARLK